eukprot:gene2662-3302_t
MTTTMKAIRVHKVGGVEEMKYEDIDIPKCKENEVLVKNQFIGVNFIDTYHRTGLYKLETPFILGREGAGFVEAVGSAVKDFKVGDRVSFFSPQSYAQFTAVPQNMCFKLPDSIDFQTGCAYMLQGLTGHYLVRTTFPLKEGQVCLIQAGAGGLGQILIQMAKLLGATVITTVSTQEKSNLVKSLGADHVINYVEVPEFSTKVRELTNGKGVDVVYDGVGKSTWLQSMKSLKTLGYLCLVGNASGPVPPIDPLLLTGNGSLFVTRPTLGDYIKEPTIFKQRCTELFQWVESGKLKLSNQVVLPLEQSGEAHTMLEGRQSKGKILLDPK